MTYLWPGFGLACGLAGIVVLCCFAALDCVALPDYWSLFWSLIPLSFCFLCHFLGTGQITEFCQDQAKVGNCQFTLHWTHDGTMAWAGNCPQFGLHQAQAGNCPQFVMSEGFMVWLGGFQITVITWWFRGMDGSPHSCKGLVLWVSPSTLHETRYLPGSSPGASSSTIFISIMLHFHLDFLFLYLNPFLSSSADYIGLPCSLYLVLSPYHPNHWSSHVLSSGSLLIVLSG